MQKGSILITGGAGFIGVNAAKYFLGKGWLVTIFDNFSRKGTNSNVRILQETFPNVQVVKGDVRYDLDELKDLAEKNDVVLHLAAQVAVTTSVKEPREDFEINALGTFNLLEAVRNSKRKPIVLYSSTNKVYGGLEQLKVEEGEVRYDFKNNILGVDEDTNLDFHSPYGCSKGTADQYVHDYSRLYGLKTVVFRQSCIYGPHQFGIEDQGWVAWFIIAGLFNKPVTIYGNGKQVRDVLFVDDLVKLYDVAINKIDIASGQIYNVGGGHDNSISLLEFLNILKNDCGVDMKYSFSDWRPGDQPIFVSDNSLASKELGWTPSTNVTNGIGKLIAWLKDNKKHVESFYV